MESGCNTANQSFQEKQLGKVSERAESELGGAGLTDIADSTDYPEFKRQPRFSEDRFSDIDGAAVAEVHPSQISDVMPPESTLQTAETCLNTRVDADQMSE